MPVHRGPDGKIIEAPTEANEPTRRLERRPGERGPSLTANPDADTAALNQRDLIPRKVAAALADVERTRLVGPLRRPPSAEKAEERPGPDMAEDPVVGWLVVIDGPGRGQARAIGYGMNGIGRGPTERISLDFGDDQMSRTGHAVLTYDPRSRKFYLQQGSGRNLTYLGEQAVLTPTEIATGADILIGRTKLRFIALCGPEFDWQDA